MHMKSKNSHPAAALRTLREFANMTLEEVADIAGTSPPYLSKVETGRANASPQFIGRISRAIASKLSHAA